MKVRRYTVTFERVLEVVIFAPEGATEKEVQAAADAEASRLDSAWDPPEWEASVSGGGLVEVPDAECELGPPNKYGFRGAVSGAFSEVDVVLGDKRDEIVNPTDASWWVLRKQTVPVRPIEFGGHRWAVSPNALIRADVLPDGLDEPWLPSVEPEMLAHMAAHLTPQSRPVTETFAAKFAPVLALGMVCQGAGGAPVVMRDGEVLAAVGAYRAEGGVRVVDGKLQATEEGA